MLNLRLAVSDPMSYCMSPQRDSSVAQTSKPATPGFKHQPTGSRLDPFFSPCALVNTIIAVLCCDVGSMLTLWLSKAIMPLQRMMAL